MTIESSPSDAREVAQLHKEIFPGFLAQLGIPFLIGYYRCVEAYPGGILLVARYEDGTAAGYAAGFLDPPAFYRFLRRRGARFILPVTRALLRRPTLLRRLILDLKYMERLAEGDVSSDGAACELSFIGVLESGSGVGSLLIDEYVLRAREIGSRSVILSTNRDSNEQVNRFYLEKGFTLVREFAQTEDRVMNEYQLELNGR